jgi:hypothetical protein
VPFGCRPSLLRPSCPPGALCRPYGSTYWRLTPDPKRVSTFHTHKVRSGWVSSVLRGHCGVHMKVPTSLHAFDSGTWVHCSIARFAVLSSQPLRRFDVTKPQQGFTCVHPSDLSPAHWRRLARCHLGLSPLLPDLSVTSDARRSREQAWTLAWIVDETHLPSLAECDLVSRVEVHRCTGQDWGQATAREVALVQRICKKCAYIHSHRSECRENGRAVPDHHGLLCRRSQPAPEAIPPP